MKRLPLIAPLGALVLWALLAHPRLGSGELGVSNTTVTTSTSTSFATATTSETVRVDTFATRLVATDPIGRVVSDDTLPFALAEPAVQAAIGAAQGALLAGPPASLRVKGPTLITTNTTLVGSTTRPRRRRSSRTGRRSRRSPRAPRSTSSTTSRPGATT